MKKLLTILFALVLVANVAGAQTVSTANEKHPLPVAVSPIISFVAIATPTLTMAAAAQQCPILPAGTKGFIVRCTTGVDINYGGSDVVAGAGWPVIGSATQATFYCTTTSRPEIYFVSTATGTPVIRFTAFK